MKLNETFSYFKAVRPSRHYTARSRAALLAHATSRTAAPTTGITLSSLFTGTLRYASAGVLTLLLIALTIGGFWLVGSISPLKLSTVDPASIQAEAEAVDIQIQLTNLSYHEPTSTAATVKTSAPALSKPSPSKINQASTPSLQTKTPFIPPATTTTEQSQTVSIDAALESLSL